MTPANVAKIQEYNRLSRAANRAQGHGHDAQASLTVRLPMIQDLAFSIFGSENLATLKYLRTSETNRLLKQASMKNFDLNFSVALLLSGLGVVYVARFLLRKYPKKSNDLRI